VVTGASGFVGRRLVEGLATDGRHRVRALTRRTDWLAPGGVEVVRVGSLEEGSDYAAALQGADAVVHCAARVHVMRDRATDPLAQFRATNALGTANLARQAAAADVRRLVFLSSIKVNGEATLPGRPFTARDAPRPADPYGISKLEAEEALRSVSAETGLEVVVVRPVLVYGPGAKGNVLSLTKWLRRRVPLPLGAIDNRRSLVALDNLVDLVVTCLDHPDAAGRTLLVSDDEDLSTTDLLRRTARAMGVEARLIPVPQRVLEGGARLLGQAGIARRLCGSLQVDISETRELLGWTPPVRVDCALLAMARADAPARS
jgi:UDP-glucose 4-epimerase